MMKDIIMGLAVGDAFGVPFEFMQRSDIEKISITDMIGCDTPHNFNSYWSGEISAGAWSDDTSLTLATMDSIIGNNGSINYYDIMSNFKKWWDENLYTSTGFAFGLGKTTDNALFMFSRGISPNKCGMDGIRDNGNGSLMRISPFSMYCILNNLDIYKTIEIINNGSSLTHAHSISRMCCFMYTILLKECLLTKDKNKSINKMIKFDYAKYFDEIAISENSRILNGSILNLKKDDIKQSGYVVDTLEAVLYSIIHGIDYESTILTAVKLGYDTDTICAIAGSIAGALYGYDSIPERWLNKLKKKDYLEELSNRFDEIVFNSQNIENNKSR